MRLTFKQQLIVQRLKEHPWNSVVEFDDIMTKTVRYAIRFWDKDDVLDYYYPNPRTVRSLINKGILKRSNGSDVFVLAEEV